MLEAMVVCKKGLVVMHMMCCPAVFDPYAIYFSNTTVDCRFAAICETIKYCIVGGSAIISICICICISQVRYLRIVSPLPPPRPLPLPPPSPLLLLSFWDTFRAYLALYS